MPHQFTPNQKTITKTCRHCGTPFRTTAWFLRHNQGFYCSQRCKIDHQRAIAAERLEERFWSKVDRSGGPDACWTWRTSCFDSGYGQFKIGKRNRRAHQVAWELTHGPIPEGRILMHVVCDNPPCCNPAHLRPGTNAENSQDMVRKGRHAEQMKRRRH